MREVLKAITAQAPGIVDTDRHDRVCALLGDPARRASRSGARAHLLTYGVGACGVCSAELRFVGRVGGLYVCDRNGCVGRRAEWVDDLVRAVVIERLSRADASDLLADAAARQARERAAGLRARLDGAADDYADGLIDREQMRRITGKLRPELERAETEAQRAVPGLRLSSWRRWRARRPRTVGTALAFAQRYALLEALDLAVIIKPGRGGPRFKPELIEFEWRREQ